MCDMLSRGMSICNEMTHSLNLNGYFVAKDIQTVIHSYYLKINNLRTKLSLQTVILM